MKIRKIIAIDLDGTLLNKDEKLSSFSEDILKQLVRNDYLIVLASGRPYRAIESFYKRIGQNAPIICYNGALCFNPKDASFPTIDLTFSPKEIKSFYSKVKDVTETFEVESSHVLYANRKDDYLDAYFPINDMRLSIGDIAEILNEKVYTCLMKSKQKHDDFIANTALKMPNIGYRHWHASPYSELYKMGADKGTCLRHIMNIYGVEKEDVLAFGDSTNDVTMLNEAGTSFIMLSCKNKGLKAKYQVTKKGNADDGVALTLEELFL